MNAALGREAQVIPSDDLHRKVALLTGASSRIGTWIAGTFADRGAKVYVNRTSSMAAAGQQLVGELPDATYVQADAAGEHDAARLPSAALEVTAEVRVGHPGRRLSDVMCVVRIRIPQPKRDPSNPPNDRNSQC